MFKSLLATTLIAATLYAAITAHAQESDQAAPKSVRATYMEKYGTTMPAQFFSVQPQHVNISLARLPNLMPGQFAVRLSVPDVWISCAEMSDLYFDISYQHLFTDARILSYQVNMITAPKEPQFGCERGYQNPSALIILDRKDIEQHNARLLRIWSEPFINRYEMELTPYSVRLIEKNIDDGGYLPYTPLKNDNVGDPLKFWFYPEKTVMLYAPSARKDQDLSTQIADFARQKGLTPLASVLPHFTPLARDDFYYYVDTGGALPHGPALRAGQQIGSINIEKKVYAVDGDKISSEAVAVYAKTPGVYE